VGAVVWPEMQQAKPTLEADAPVNASRLGWSDRFRCEQKRQSAAVRRFEDFLHRMEQMPTSIHPDVGIGHVHLKVADLDRALRFYRDMLGFALT
jgi:hypothetical protein